jgi:GT2 family glycosyltransferase
MIKRWNPLTINSWAVPSEAFLGGEFPFITLAVLSFNRREDLRRTLDVLVNAVQYPHYEVVVTDNGSIDGSVEMISKEFPSVIVHREQENLGVSLRNKQAQLARGEFLFSFDDDSIPASPAMVSMIVEHMQQHPDIDVLSTTCYQPLGGVNETEGFERYYVTAQPERGFEMLCIIEGAVCFRCSSLRSVAGYEPLFMYGAEGTDLSVQFYEQDKKVILAPWFLTLHFYSSTMRVKGSRSYGSARNSIWMFARHWPLPAAAILTGLVFVRQAFAFVNHSDLRKFIIRGLKDGVKHFWRLRRTHKRLSWKQTFSLGVRAYMGLFRWG